MVFPGPISKRFHRRHVCPWKVIDQDHIQNDPRNLALTGGRHHPLTFMVKSEHHPSSSPATPMSHPSNHWIRLKVELGASPGPIQPPVNCGQIQGLHMAPLQSRRDRPKVPPSTNFAAQCVQCCGAWIDATDEHRTAHTKTCPGPILNDRNSRTGDSCPANAGDLQLRLLRNVPPASSVNSSGVMVFRRWVRMSLMAVVFSGQQTFNAHVVHGDSSNP